MLQVHQRLVKVVVWPEDDGFCAAVPCLPGCVSQGATEEEAFANIEDALKLVLESYAENGEMPPYVDERRMVRHVVVPLDPPQEWQMDPTNGATIRPPAGGDSANNPSRGDTPTEGGK